MLTNAIEIREVTGPNGAGVHYELYDSDTGTSLGIYDSLDRAKAERKHMNTSDRAVKQGGTDADAGTE